MANTNAFDNINNVVDRFMFKYKLPMEDAVLFTEHACECFRKIRTRHSDAFTTRKVTPTSKGIIEFPDDCIKVIDVMIPINGEWWSSTERKDMVNTTTIVNGAETRDDTDQGEGVDIQDPGYWGYGGTGGANTYYHMIDYDARRIFLDGWTTEKVVLHMTTSGLNLDGDTIVPEQCVPVIDAYMFWKKAWWDGSPMNEKQYREKIYLDELLELRVINFMPSKNQLLDIFYSTNTQTPLR